MTNHSDPPSLPRTASRRLCGVLACVLAALLAATVAGPAPATPISQPQRAIQTSTSANPLAAGPWGVYTGDAEGDTKSVYHAYESATGTNKRLLAKVALRSRVIWRGSWISTDRIAAALRADIANMQNGNPRKIVPLAIFRLWPRGEARKNEPLTQADQTAYRRWVDAAARGIGSSRVLMILEPDLAVSLAGWRPSVRLALATYAARKFGALPNTTVYLDAADSDWLSVTQKVSLLRRAGIRYVRGFALGATHYSATSSNITNGSKVVTALRQAGVARKHFVIDTADNGRPFTFKQYHAAHPNGDFDNAETCRTRTERRCDTLGIPPTPYVAQPKWGLSPAVNRLARQNVDGYLWFGRPWLIRQSSPFSLQRTLQIARTTPYE